MTGYNLTRLISGAEGTLAVISNITFKLTRHRADAPSHLLL